MMGIYSKGSSKALCFVTDTTKSMSDDIEAVRTITSSIINSEVGTEDEPSLYILVPFNDPGRIFRILQICQIIFLHVKRFSFCLFYLLFFYYKNSHHLINQQIFMCHLIQYCVFCI